MSLIQALILAIVEGATEFLPISSTAHLVLTSQLLAISQTDFVKSFEIIIQLGAILAVVLIYFEELYHNTQLWYKTVLAFLPSAIIGFFAYDFIKQNLLGDGFVSATALITGGIILIVVERTLLKANPGYHTKTVVLDNPRLIPPDLKTTAGTKTVTMLSPLQLITVGLFQSLAMIPGVSRSAASIIGGLSVGLNKTEATKFSFFLAIPTMLGATTLDLYKSQLNFTYNEVLILLVGFFGSFFTALFAVKAFIDHVQRHSFLSFGIYRIAAGTAWLLAIFKLYRF